MCICRVSKHYIDVVIHGFNFRMMFVSHVSQGFYVIINVVVHGLSFRVKMVKVRFR